MIANDVVGLPAQESHRRAGKRFQARPLGPRADHHEPPAQAGAGGHRVVDALVRDERRDNEVKVFTALKGRRRPVILGIDGRRNHPAVAIVGGGDSLANGFGDRHEMCDAASGRAIPVSQTVKKQASHGSADRPIGPAFEVCVSPLPGIAHRCEAVANVGHAAGRLDRLGHTVAQADHQVNVANLPGPGRQRHEGKQVSIVLEDSRHSLERRRANRHRLDGRTGRSRAMKERVQVMPGERPGRGPRGTSRHLSCRSASRGQARRAGRRAPGASGSAGRPALILAPVRSSGTLTLATLP